MSEQAARSALSRMNLREQFIAPHYTGLSSDLTLMSTTDPAVAQEKFLNNTRHELCEAYGFNRREQSKPFAFAEGFAIIPVHGTLINRFGSSYGYVTGYNFIRSQHFAAMADDDVKYIIHDHNSFGGEAAGCFELAGQIAESRGSKPIMAVVDSNCYSASYALASAADKIAVIPSAGVGSVGVVAMHVDMSKMLDRMGVTITFIHSGEHKVDGNPYEALSADVKADIQKGVDKSRAKFVKVVAQNLGLDEKVVYDTEARTYRADDALALGLIHAIAEPQTAMQSLIDGDDSDVSDEEAKTTKSTKEQDMTVAAKPEDASVDQAAVRKAERERCAGIMNSEEAKGRSILANHFALNTDMSVEAAREALAVSPLEAKVEPKKDEAKGGDDKGQDKAEQGKGDQFAKAMDKNGTPNVGADDQGKTTTQDASAGILASFAMATGFKVAE